MNPRQKKLRICFMGTAAFAIPTMKAVVAAENLGEILRLVVESGCGIDVSVEAGFARGL
jgi:hypothetical protein